MTRDTDAIQQSNEFLYLRFSVSISSSLRVCYRCFIYDAAPVLWNVLPKISDTSLIPLARLSIHVA